MCKYLGIYEVGLVCVFVLGFGVECGVLFVFVCVLCGVYFLFVDIRDKYWLWYVVCEELFLFVLVGVVFEVLSLGGVFDGSV